VAFYVENFLDFPVGAVVPTGSYARSEQLWLAEPSGKVVEILSVDNDRAALDIDDDGEADSSEAQAELVIQAPELTELAELYAAGQSLWRVSMAHFSQWDHNWPFAPPEDAEPPSVPEPSSDTDEDCQRNGSIVHCESQTLGEVIGLVGTPFALVYSSRRAPGYRARSTIDLLRVIHDHLGSVRLILAEDGDIEERIDYDSYGNVIEGSVASTPFGFAGGLHDPDTGLVRFGARDYDPETGRWLTKDPSGLAGGLNLYQYANSDPVNYIDVNGENPIFILFACFLLTRLMMAIRGAAIGAIEGAALQTA